MSKTNKISITKPIRPALVKLVNFIGPAYLKLTGNYRRLNIDKLLNEAKRTTGLQDFGDDQYIVGLEKLLYSLNEENDLNPIGKIIAKQIILRPLVNRLRMVDYVKKNPRVKEEKIKSPIFILGLPRTGTTTLHYLMAEDRAARTCKVWESFYFTKPHTDKSYLQNSSITKTKIALSFYWKLIPGIRAIHDFNHLTPQECIIFTGHTFISFGFPTQFYLPSYSKWLKDADLSYLYEQHKLSLQFMQANGLRQDYWLLKAPAHLFCVEQIFKTYPDAKIIQTHREPIRAVASSASLNYAMAQLTSDHVNIKDFGKLHLELLSEWMDINVSQRQQLSQHSKQIYDMSFLNFVQKPIEEIKKIYTYFNKNYTDDTASKMLHFRENYKHDKFGKHIYTESSFGLNKQIDEIHFKKYLQYFNHLYQT